MRPIDRAIDRRKGHDIAVTTTWPRDQNTIPRDPVAAVTSCLCDHVLGSTRWRLPLRRYAEGLVTLYFTQVQRMYPILHERTFRQQHECLWQSVPGSNAGTAGCSGLCKHEALAKIFPSTVYIVFVLASLFESGAPETNTRQAEDYFRLARKLIFWILLTTKSGLSWSSWAYTWGSICRARTGSRNVGILQVLPFVWPRIWVCSWISTTLGEKVSLLQTQPKLTARCAAGFGMGVCY